MTPSICRPSGASISHVIPGTAGSTATFARSAFTTPKGLGKPETFGVLGLAHIRTVELARAQLMLPTRMSVSALQASRTTSLAQPLRHATRSRVGASKSGRNIT